MKQRYTGRAFLLLFDKFMFQLPFIIYTFSYFRRSSFIIFPLTIHKYSLQKKIHLVFQKIVFKRIINYFRINAAVKKMTALNIFIDH